MRQKYCPELIKHLKALVLPPNQRAMRCRILEKEDGGVLIRKDFTNFRREFSKEELATMLRDNSWLRSKQLMWDFGK